MACPTFHFFSEAPNNQQSSICVDGTVDGSHVKMCNAKVNIAVGQTP